jgi:ribosomal protein S18 acetylase RimI-like enzyme
MASPAECGLIPPSSGRPKGCLAAFGPPRMSNGYVILDNSFFGHAFIPLLLVGAGNRRRGIGTQLIVEAENRCRREKLFTSANETNVAAQTLFEQREFVRSGRIENLDDTDDELVFCKWLRDT